MRDHDGSPSEGGKFLGGQGEGFWMKWCMPLDYVTLY